MRFFNTAGPVNCNDHYCIPPLERIDLDEILMLIAQKKYFVIHAPRQTGKTSCLLALMDYLNQDGTYECLYVNVENAQAARENVKEGMRTIIYDLACNVADFLHDTFLKENWKAVFEESGEFSALHAILSLWTKQTQKPLVILIDEVDSLVGDTLISFLRQLRSGYTKRPDMFPQSILLCGVRDVRDYRIHSDKEKSIITGGSAFNIKAISLRLDEFSRSDINLLYQEHTKETAQVFEENALELVWEFTEGQPWLVNALGYEICFEIRENRGKKTLTAEMVHDAKENIILRRDTHLDQLADKLCEERVYNVIEPMLKGIDLAPYIKPDHIQYVMDLGMIRRDKNGFRPANAIYKEIIPREIAFIPQLNFESRFDSLWYVRKDGTLDMMLLIKAFQEFFRQHSESWLDRFQYKEAGPQLLMQAFLQRIINHSGRVEREYGLGRMRTDILVLWNHRAGVQKIVIELKILYGTLEKITQKGMEQTYQYMDKCGANEGHLVIFDRSEKRTWDEKIFCTTKTYQGREIVIWGM